MIDLDALITYRDQIYERYRRIWDIPLIKRRFTLIAKNLYPGMRILDLGDGEWAVKTKIKRGYPDVLYQSIDIDRRLLHDNYSLDQIDEQFDLILLSDIIEYLGLEDGVKMLGRINELLVEGGSLIINTPNIFNHSHLWLDAANKVAYSYDELGGIVLSQGFDLLEIYRTYTDSFPKYFLCLTFFYPFHRILNIDFAQSIVILARKKDQNIIRGGD
jgi:hypothetical protein